jgi:hypothetical protein
MIGLLERLFGSRIADALRAPFVLGDPPVFRAAFGRAGIPEVAIETVIGAARFPSIESWVHTDVRGWTLADMIDEAQYQRLLGAAEQELKRYAEPDGTIAFAAPAHIATATKG